MTLKELIDSKGLTAITTAKLCGVTRITVYSWVNGKTDISKKHWDIIEAS